MTVTLHRLADWVSGGLIGALIVLAPWLWMIAPTRAIWVINVGGYTLGLLLGLKWVIRWVAGDEGLRWDAGFGRWPTRVLGWLTVVLLLWCLVSAWNVRATYSFAERRLVYQERYVRWLPHSYDAPKTWAAFWQYLGMAGFFWGLRDWLLGRGALTRPSAFAPRAAADKSGTLFRPTGEGRGEGSGALARRTGEGRGEGRAWSNPVAVRTSPGGSGTDRGRPRSVRLSRRLQVLFWLVCLSGGLVALHGLTLRAAGTDLPAWMAKLGPVGLAPGEFGPFGYRVNAAQYLNLSWPLGLALWWSWRRRPDCRGQRVPWAGYVWGVVLLGFIVAAIGGVVASASRGGVLVAAGALVMGITVLLGPGRLAGDHRGWLGIIVVVVGSIGLATFGGWPALKRLMQPQLQHPTGLGERLSDFTLRCELRCPSGPVAGRQTLAWLRAESLVRGDTSLALQLDGSHLTFVLSKYRQQGGTALRANVTNSNLAGRIVELVLARSDQVMSVWVDGARVPVTASGTRSLWTNALDASVVVLPYRSPRWSADGSRMLRRITLFDAALTPAELTPDLRSSAPLSAKAAVPVFDLSATQMDRPAALHAQLRSRHLIHEGGRQIAAEHRWLGTGPGTFASVYRELRRENPRLSDQAYAHNDWLETRITFGRVGFVLVVAALVCATLAWWLPSGIPVPGVCLALVGTALAGCLVHAGFDYPLQTPAVLLQFLVGTAVVSAASLGRER